MKKLFLILLIVLLPLSNTFCIGNNWSGDGSATNPFQITTEADLQQLAVDVNGGNNYATKHFVLTRNIKLWSGWNSIGSTDAICFQGFFNGKGHVISGLNQSDATMDNVGLFGYIKNANIDSVGIVSASFTGKNNVGGIVGYADNSTISNSFVSGTIHGNYNVGGIAGSINKSIILNAYSIASITGNNMIAGIVGNSTQSINNAINNCFNVGSINATSTAIGGIVGLLSPQIAILSCFYLKQTSLLNGNFIGTVKTSTQLKSADFVTLLNGTLNSNAWSKDNGTNNGYPTLSWQNTQNDSSYMPIKDSTTVLHNPLMNLNLYLTSDSNGNWSSPTWYLNDANTVGNCNTVYLRSAWVNFEPTEGNYVWKNNTSFKNLVAAVKAKGWHLGFRIMCQDNGLSSTVARGTPQYVFDAMKAAGYTNPYSISQPKYPDVTNPVWQAKFKAFILAFGAEFNDPMVTDFVDANGLGLWGEGNLVGIPTPNNDHSQEKAYYDWHLGVYAQAFTKVILAVTPGTFGKDDAEMKATDLLLPIGKYGCIWRKDGMGQSISVPYVEATAPQLAPFVSTFPTCPVICEPWSSFTSTDRDYMSRLIHDVILYHGMNLTYNAAWCANPDLLAQLVAKIGYRLRPVEIDLPKQQGVSDFMKIYHTWTNDGVGVIPNSNVRWNNKYVVSFALFKSGDSTPTKVYLDTNTNPGVFVAGTYTTYTTNIQWNVPEGTYQLAVGIIDQTKPTNLSLNLAMKTTRKGGWYVIGDVNIVNKITGLKEINSKQNQIDIFPNPVSSQLRIKGITGLYDLQIYNTQGRVFLTRNSFDVEQKLDVSSLPTGQYLSFLNNKEGQKRNIKFIIIKQ
jgi:hypothetical protein